MRDSLDVADAEAAQLKHEVGSAVRWSAINSLFSRVSQVGVGIILARLIAPDQFGVYAAALVVLNIVISVSEMGVSVALVRAKEEDVARIAPTVSTLSIASGTLLALLCAIGAPWFAQALNAPAATSLIRVMSLALIVAGASATPAAFLQREFRQDHKLVADMASFFIGTAIAIGMAFAGFGAMSLAWSRVATNVTAAVIMFALTKQRYRPGFDRKEAKALLAFGLPLAGSSLLVFAVLNVDYIVVGSVLGPLALGLYLLAFNLSSWPVGAFSMPVRSVSLPAFSRLREEPERFRKAFQRGLQLLALFTVPACVLLGAFGRPLVRFVYGPRWGQAASVLALLAALAAARVALELAYDCLASAGRSRSILYIHALWLAALVPALTIGAHLDGIRGVGIGHVLVVFCLVVPAYLAALRPFGLRAGELGVSLVRPLLGGAAMTAVAWVVQRSVDGEFLQLAIGGTVACAAYGIAVLPLRQEALAVLRRTAAD